MKKIFLTLAVLAASATAFAQTDNTSTAADNTTKTEQTNDNDNNSRKGRRGNNDFKPGHSAAFKAMEGLNLTDNQKAQLKELRTKLRDNSHAMKDSDKNNKKEKLTPEQRQQKMTEMQAARLQARKDFLAGIKSILTPEQYVQYLENYYMLDNGNAQRGQRDINGFGSRDGRQNKPQGRRHNHN